MNIFKRLLKIGQAEIHALVEKMENPVSSTEQGVRELNDDLETMVEGYAKVRAQVIRFENKIQEKQSEAVGYESKAKRLLEKAQAGELSVDNAEKLALEALRLKNEILQDIESLQVEKKSNESKAFEINEHIEVLKFNIVKWQKELATLKAKQKINAVSSFANKQMAAMDQNSTIEALEKLKEKVQQNEAMSDVYGEFANERINRDIDFALNNEKSALQKELEELKNRLK